jgi:hypothetical protein
MDNTFGDEWINLDVLKNFMFEAREEFARIPLRRIIEG